MTKFFKNKTKKEAKEVMPRDNEAILTDYNAVKARAGEVQYLLFAYEKELTRLNQVLENLNYESEARKNLDKHAAVAKPEGVANESVRQ